MSLKSFYRQVLIINTYFIPEALIEESIPLMSKIAENVKPLSVFDSANEHQVSIIKKQIILNPTISLLNFISFNLYYLIVIFAYVSVDTLQPSLLTDPSYYNISDDDLTRVNSTILVWDMAIKVILAPFYGFLCEKIGRKPVVFIGITSMCLGIGLFPFIGNGTVFPLFVVARALYANGAIACIVVPLLADYVDYETKGRAAGLLVVLAGLGAVLSSSYCLSLTTNISMGNRYVYLAVGIWIVGILVALGLKGGKYHRNLYYDAKAEQAKQTLASSTDIEDSVGVNSQSLTNGDAIGLPEEKGLLKNFTQGIHQGKNPWILLGYIISFLSRGDTGILSFTLVIWSKNYYPSDQSDQNDAENQAYMLSGISYVVLLLTALFFGFFSDKYSKFKLIVVTHVSTIIGLILLVLCSGPNDGLAYISMFFIGIGIAGYELFSLQLVNKYSNTKLRGSVNAMSSLLGVIGLVIISIGGGYLMGVDINASFYMFLGFAALALVISVFLYRKSEILKKL